MDELSPVISPNMNSFRKDTLSAEKKLAMTLYYLLVRASFFFLHQNYVNYAHACSFHFGIRLFT